LLRDALDSVGKLLGSFEHKNINQSISNSNLIFIKLASEKIDLVDSIFQHIDYQVARYYRATFSYIYITCSP
jgi:hypothetical protein